MLVEEYSQTPAHLSPIIFRVFLSSEAQDPSQSPPFASPLFLVSLDAAVWLLEWILCLPVRQVTPVPGRWGVETYEHPHPPQLLEQEGCLTSPRNPREQRTGLPPVLSPSPRSHSHLQNDVKKHGVAAGWALGPFAADSAAMLVPGHSSPLATKYKETVWG